MISKRVIGEGNTAIAVSLDNGKMGKVYHDWVSSSGVN